MLAIAGGATASGSAPRGKGFAAGGNFALEGSGTWGFEVALDLLMCKRGYDGPGAIWKCKFQKMSKRVSIGARAHAPRWGVVSSMPRS